VIFCSTSDATLSPSPVLRLRRTRPCSRARRHAARQLGLVNWVVPPSELGQVTARIATRLAAGPTRAYGEAKRLLNRSLAESMETQMEEELFAFARCTHTHDLAEGVTAFVEKRKPNFKGA
jgi:2-(1,2-epoxy-1,2-dihydrophenyl)acetyl-CoA isomerase